MKLFKGEIYMEMSLTVSQLREVIKLAENNKKAIMRRDQKQVDTYNELASYMQTIGYDAVLDIEALLMYGTELEIYDRNASLAECYRQVWTDYGGSNGDIDIAISYIAGKTPLYDRLLASLDALTFVDGKIQFSDGE